MLTVIADITILIHCITDKKKCLMKHFIIFIVMTVCLFSCGSIDLCYRKEAKRVLKDFSREYTGLDTLIRIDGYYYHEDGTRVPSPFMLSNNGEFHILHVRYENHIQIQEDFRKGKSDKDKSGRGFGHYTLSGDTIKAGWAMLFQYDCYNIFSQQYLIVNDTTLKRIWHLCETCSSNGGGKRNPTRNEFYKFYKYPVEMK
jgi:hypothetical protein